MKARLEDRNKAIELRRLGKSYREIQGVIRVSRGLLSGWLKDLPLNAEEASQLARRIEERRHRGRLSAKIASQARKIERERQAFKEAERLFVRYRKDPMFLLGVTLYWAEGARDGQSFRFMNADPDMILIMRRWVERYLGVSREKILARLFIHNIPGYETVPGFWLKNLGLGDHQLKVSHYTAKNKVIRKGPGYKGCVRLTIHGVRYLRLMKAWQTLVIQYYGKA